MKMDFGSVGCEVHAESGERLHACEAAEVRSLVRDNGWVSFSGFDVSVAEFESFTSQFGLCANTRTVHYPPGGEALGFHAEDAYNPYRPDTIWFLCVFEGSDGGAPTGVVDGVELLSELSDTWQRFCRANTMRFDRQWSAGLWQDAIGRDRKDELDSTLAGIPGITHRFLGDGDLHVSFQTPIITRTPAGVDSFSNTILQAVTEPPFYGMSLGDGTSVPAELAPLVQEMAINREKHIGWQAGQVAVIDNFRMMHRRGEYRGADRDLRARHCENFFGSVLPDVGSTVSAWAKSLIQGDEGYPIRVGPADSVVTQIS